MANLVKNVATVLSAFVGIRGKRSHEEVAATLTPVQIIITGVVAAALFVTTVILGVRFLISIA
ncbi:MAG: DUF2970 domain-containing protein [Methyloversatilis sp.]|jgi:hypothetical protein|nr:DUF2970 domain-containing protein [Methyloversatilis sp.]MBP6194440.1 DUF2970 domain-containing protein [Methyloversatilis sp.]MBP9117309.1 DUF2970 domain-containing protein [Methyloversatilis sp.]